MAYLSAENTLDERRKFEKSAAKALAGLAHVLMIDYLRGWNNATNINILVAEQAVQKACALDPSVALAHVAKGQIREVEGDLKGAIEEFDEALRLNDKLPIAYAHMANAKILRGLAEEAPGLLDKAIGLPDADLGLCYWFKGRAYFNTAAYFDKRDDYDKAIESLKISVDLRRTTWFSLAHLISAYALIGQVKDAKKDIDEYCHRFGAKWPLSKIKDYYSQPKYRDRHPQLEAAIQKYFKGLEDAKEEGFPENEIL